MIEEEEAFIQSKGIEAKIAKIENLGLAIVEFNRTMDKEFLSNFSLINETVLDIYVIPNAARMPTDGSMFNYSQVNLTWECVNYTST